MAAAFDFGTIQAKYADLKFKSGWTFLCCHEDRLRDARIAIVGLNPGGRDDEGPYGSQWATGENPYYAERWGKDASGKSAHDRLQLQIQKWHDLAGVTENETLCAQFAPFRSRDWAGVKDQERAVLDFSRELWCWVLANAAATTYLTMGKVPGQQIATLLGAEPCASLPTGWGKQKIEVYRNGDGRRVVAMPHPSRFTLFDRADGASAVAEASFAEALSFER